ncbi:MAG: tRNA epoxyqueuosine(34) reductase QueG [Acidobacteria bacterium]|nr:tRNA epoxyqueuosine(34) reductase QueG [Acidobacteriota bacterium]
MEPMTQLSRQIREEARRLGFLRIGFAAAGKSEAATGLRAWLERGYQGTMDWMGRDPAQRTDPRRLFPDARTVISVAMSYHSGEEPSADPLEGAISRYAWGGDYHELLRERMQLLLAFIQKQSRGARGKLCVDSSPIHEKAWAARSGVGWQGKHSNTIVKGAGCWIFLGEILVNRRLINDAPALDHCGSCTRCIDVCPTVAIVEPYVVDSRLCISYLTIELRGPIPEPLRASLGNRIFGCDDCLDVCPWNRFQKPTPEKRFLPRPENRNPGLGDLANLTAEEFRERFRGSPVQRARYDGFLRNVAVALGNSASGKAVVPLKRLLHHDSPLVRSHAAWALGRLSAEEACLALEQAGQEEPDPLVRAEIDRALETGRVARL